MLKGNRSSIVSFLLLYIISAFISLFQTLTQPNYPGELGEFTRSITSFDVVAISLLNIISFFVCYFVFLALTGFRLKFDNKIHVEFNKKRINKVLTLLLAAQLSFLLTTNVGKVAVTASDVATSIYSPLFAFLKPEPFIYMFFLAFRTEKNFTYRKNILFTFNILLFISFKILQGWTSFLLIMFFLEIYARFQEKNNKFVLLFPIFIIILGGGIYQYAFELKNEIRGVKKVEPLTYYQGVEQLTSRLSMNPVSLGAYENDNKIIELYKEDNREFKESVSLLRPIIPNRFIDKDYRILNNNVIESFYPDLNQYTSSDFGAVIYYYILFRASLPDFITTILIAIILILFAKIYFDSMSLYNGQYDILLFFIVFYSFYTVSLENVFGQGFFPYLFSTLFFFITGGIRLVRKSEI